MHIGWAWGEADGNWYLDFLAEHRMMGMLATRLFADGSLENLGTPRTFLPVTGDPEKDKLAEIKFYKHNRQTYKFLRDRGLLPPIGQNIGSQDMNEVLVSGLFDDTSANGEPSS